MMDLPSPFCVYCEIDRSVEDAVHAETCPEVTGVYPVSEFDVLQTPGGFRCLCNCGCGKHFNGDDLYSRRYHPKIPALFIPVCLACEVASIAYADWHVADAARKEREEAEGIGNREA